MHGRADILTCTLPNYSYCNTFHFILYPVETSFVVTGNVLLVNMTNVTHHSTIYVPVGVDNKVGDGTVEEVESQPTFWWQLHRPAKDKTNDIGMRYFRHTTEKDRMVSHGFNSIYHAMARERSIDEPQKLMYAPTTISYSCSNRGPFFLGLGTGLDLGRSPPSSQSLVPMYF